MSSFSYSIIIPARNEEKNIFDCINSIISNKDIDNFDLEIIVVDDHST
ncbi:MAG: glycosyltransferase, partial [Saprospiraceae bacterium]|nr:glycosyltransferase [Saprospiraceae bacterium]